MARVRNATDNNGYPLKSIGGLLRGDLLQKKNRGSKKQVSNKY